MSRDVERIVVSTRCQGGVVRARGAELVIRKVEATPMTLVNERARTYDTIQSAIKLSTCGGLDVCTQNATVPRGCRFAIKVRIFNVSEN